MDNRAMMIPASIGGGVSRRFWARATVRADYDMLVAGITRLGFHAVTPAQ